MYLNIYIYTYLNIYIYIYVSKYIYICIYIYTNSECPHWPVCLCIYVYTEVYNMVRLFLTSLFYLLLVTVVYIYTWYHQQATAQTLDVPDCPRWCQSSGTLTCKDATMYIYICIYIYIYLHMYIYIHTCGIANEIDREILYAFSLKPQYETLVSNGPCISIYTDSPIYIYIYIYIQVLLHIQVRWTWSSAGVSNCAVFEYIYIYIYMIQ